MLLLTMNELLINVCATVKKMKVIMSMRLVEKARLTCVLLSPPPLGWGNGALGHKALCVRRRRHARLASPKVVPLAKQCPQTPGHAPPLSHLGEGNVLTLY